jgi:thioesterase domain-containing protein
MLMPIHTSGTKPPLFLLHGQFEHVNAKIFAQALGPDRPLYAIHPNGMDGREPVIDNVPDMVRAYVEQIRGARPTGPLHIGGFCSGNLATIEVARALREEGRQVGPVILGDPPVVPPGLNARTREVNYRHPSVAKVLYRSVRERLSHYKDGPFDPRDPQQLHAASLAGVGSMVALARHVPQPFSGSAQLIMTPSRAAKIFDPASPWQRLLPGPRMVHVVPWDHTEFFCAGLEHVARVFKFLLEESTGWGTVVAPTAVRTPPSSIPATVVGSRLA